MAGKSFFAHQVLRGQEGERRVYRAARSNQAQRVLERSEAILSGSHLRRTGFPESLGK